MELSYQEQTFRNDLSYGKIRIGVIRLPRISNFTDFDQLKRDSDVNLSYIETPEQLAKMDAVIIPGTKSTIPDLLFMKEQGLFDAVKEFNGLIVGICGGYQMLGECIQDPGCIESGTKETAGFALLPVTTELLPCKETHQVQATLDDAGLYVIDCKEVLSGYEIHSGVTTPLGEPRPFARIFKRGETAVDILDGSVSKDNRVFGTYLHGIFDNTRFREGFLNFIRQEKGLPIHKASRAIKQSDPFDRLADHLEQNLDMPQLLAICELKSDAR